MNEKKWKSTSKNILKSELRRKNIDYNQLSEKLTKIGIFEPSQNINSKINRGTFSFIFFLQCMEAIETNNITLRIRENINE